VEKEKKVKKNGSFFFRICAETPNMTRGWTNSYLSWCGDYKGRKKKTGHTTHI